MVGPTGTRSWKAVVAKLIRTQKGVLGRHMGSCGKQLPVSGGSEEKVVGHSDLGQKEKLKSAHNIKLQKTPWGTEEKDK